MGNLFALFASHVADLAPHLLAGAAEALAPFVNAKVKITLRVDVDGPGQLDPVFEAAAAGHIDTTGIHLDGMPTGKVIRVLSPLVG